MATYLITCRNGAGEPMVSVNISGINQEPVIVDELDVVNAVRAYLATLPNSVSVVAQKYEQVITTV